MPEEERMRPSTNVEEPEVSSTLYFKMKAIAVVEFIAVLIALVLPITPSKTGKPLKWPATWAEYFEDVFYAFLLGNGLLLVIFLVGWVYVKHLERREGTR